MTNAGVQHCGVGSQGLIQLPKCGYLLSFQMINEGPPCSDDAEYMIFNLQSSGEQTVIKFL